MRQLKTDTHYFVPPNLIAIASGKGGVGKTLLTTTAYGLIATSTAGQSR